MEKKKQSKEKKGQSNWRRIYRRMRVYLPLAILLLSLMVVFLPIRGGWIASLIEGQIEKRAPLNVEIESARIHLWDGKITLENISVQHTDHPESEAATLDRLELEGAFGQLASGDGEYPRIVRITKPSSLTVVRDINGIEVSGPIYDLIQSFQTSEDEEDKSESGIPKFTPEVLLTDFELFIDDKVEDKRHDIFVSNFSVDQRLGKNIPVHASLNGFVKTNSLESFSLDVNYLLDEKIAHVRFDVDEIKYIQELFDTPIEIDSRELTWKIDIDHSDEEDIAVSGNLTSGYVEIADKRLGGIQFFERDLSIQTDLTINSATSKIKDWALRVSSPSLRIDGDGSFVESKMNEGEARLAVRKIPPVAFRLLNKWGQDEGLFFERETTSTLTIDLAASGKFDDLENLEIDGSVNLRGWQIQSGDLPSPIVIRQIDIDATGSDIELNNVDIRYQNLHTKLSGALKDWKSDSPKISLLLDLTGNGKGLLALAKQQNLVSSEIRQLEIPFQATFDASLQLEKMKRDGDIVLQGDELTTQPYRILWDSADTKMNGNLSWQEGSVSIEQLIHPVSFLGGRLDFSDSAASLGYIQAQYRDLILDGNLELNSPTGKWNADTEISANLNVDTSVEQVLEIVRQEIGQNLIPFPVSGNSSTSISLSGKILSPKDFSYTVSSIFENLSTRIPIPYTELEVRDGFMTINLQDDKVEIPSYAVKLNDRLNISGNLIATDKIITSDLNVKGDIAEASNIIRKELKQMVLEGEANSQGRIVITPRDELLPAPSLLERWIKSISAASKKDKVFIGIKEDSPFRIEADGKVFPVANVGVFHRDMPQPVRNVRGGITYDETGFQFINTIADVGPAKDLNINGYAQFGHVANMVILKFDVEGDEINFNDWKSGWGDQEWATRPFVQPDFGEEDTRPEKNITRIFVDVKLDDTDFLSVKAKDVVASMTFNSYRFQNNTVDVFLEAANVYEGTLTGDANLEFPKRTEDNRALFKTQLRPRQTELRLFMNDLRNKEHKIRGLVTGTANIAGRIDDYPSWTGDADFRITKSRFIGEQSFVGFTTALNLGQREAQPDTTITGKCVMANEVIRFPKMEVESSEILMLTSGSIDHDGYIDFILTVDLFREQLDNIPIIGGLNRLINDLQKNLVSYRVTGKIYEPKINTIPLATSNTKFFEEGRSRFLDEESSSN